MTSIRSGTIRLDGGGAYYEVQGEGEPMLLLHGGMATLREWDAIIPLLTDRFQTIAYDRAGIGRSSGRAFQADIVANGVEELAAIKESLGLERVYLFGSCIGGAIALSYAARSPASVRSVMTTGVLFHGDERLRQRLATAFRPWAGMPRAFHDMMRRLQGEADLERAYETFRCMYTQSAPVGYASSPDYDLRGELPKIKCRTLTVHGDRDPFWGVEQPASSYTLLAEGALWVLPRCAHYPHVEYPALVATQARMFFTES